jgi:hypothetical protein
MAIAQRHAGVTRGYKAKPKKAGKPRTVVLVRLMVGIRRGARELAGYVRDEIAYATMDTARLVEYLRAELGLRTRARVLPVAQELENFVHERDLIHDIGNLTAEQV